jgi:hypothetical protein
MAADEAAQDHDPSRLMEILLDGYIAENRGLFAEGRRAARGRAGSSGLRLLVRAESLSLLTILDVWDAAERSFQAAAAG